jgi:tripartite-type tricarboxylate transporter receptor subunit TctC
MADFLPGYDAGGYIGISAPKNTPAEIVGKLNNVINAALADARFKQRVAQLGDEAFVGSPSAFGTFVVEFTDKWGKILRAANIKL